MSRYLAQDCLSTEITWNSVRSTCEPTLNMSHSSITVFMSSDAKEKQGNYYDSFSIVISKRTHWYVDEALLHVKGELDKVHFAWKLQRKANRHEHFSVVGDGEVVCRRQNVRDASLNGISKVGVRCPDTFAPTVAQLVLRQRFLRGQIDSLGNGVLIRWLLQTVVRPVVVIEHVRIKGLSQPGVRQKLNKKIQTMRLYLRWSLAEFDVEDNQWDGNFNRFAVFSHRCNISVVVRWKYVHFILFGFLGHI